MTSRPPCAPLWRYVVRPDSFIGEYQGNTRSLFNGLALALVQSTAESGPVRLTARVQGLREEPEIATQRSPTNSNGA